MKKIYTFILIVIFAISVKAQFTVTSSMFPIVGDIEKTWDVDTTNLVVGSSGTNQIWNYTGITIPSTVTATSNTYVALNTAPHYTAFTGATIASSSDGINYDFSSYGSNITMYGTANNTLVTTYGNPLTYANIPFTYGTISSDTYSSTSVNGTQTITLLGSITTTGDAWGTLNLPGGKTYPNTLRLKLQITQTATVASSSTLSPTYNYTINANNYVHMSAASKFALFSMGINTVTVKSGTFTNTSKSKSGTVGDVLFSGITELKDGADYSVFPNPAKTELTILLTGNNHLTNLDVINNLGQIVKDINNVNFNSFNANKASINLEGISPGIYYVKLKTNTGQGIKKIIVE